MLEKEEPSSVSGTRVRLTLIAHENAAAEVTAEKGFPVSVTPKMTSVLQKLGDEMKAEPQKAKDISAIVSYVSGIYEPARQVMTRARYPEEQKTVFVPLSEKFCPMESIVLKGKEQAAWQALRDRLGKQYNFKNIKAVFYDGTIEDLERRMAAAGELTSRNALVYMDEAVAAQSADKIQALSPRATFVKEALTPKAELAEGEAEGAYMSIGGHIVLAIGILDIVKNGRKDAEFLNRVAALMSAIARNAVSPEELKQMIADGSIRLKLPPVRKIDISNNMATYFIMEEAAMTAL